MAEYRTVGTRPRAIPKEAVVGAASPKYEEIRQDLQRQRAALVQTAMGRPLSEGIEVAVFPDLSDQATAESNQHFILSLKERDRALLKQIDQALARLATGSYGVCTRCDEEIPFRRLKAQPMTTLCVTCKTIEEEEDRMRH